MPEFDVDEFFDWKRPWSEYKDLILDYYLKPYLDKVATLGKRVVVVDCCAGRGRFTDGAEGSPLIICRRLKELHDRGKPVMGVFIERKLSLFSKLRENLKDQDVPRETHQGDFRDYLPQIEAHAQNSTILLYIDPMKASDLRFDDMRRIFSHLHKGQSVETLVNFMSPGFARRAQQCMARAPSPMRDKKIEVCNRIAGGDYWQAALKLNGQGARLEALAAGFEQELAKQFRWTLRYPVRENYGELPKYHLVFGSRHKHGIDLMNRGMTLARRKFLGAEFPKDQYLINMAPKDEDVDPAEIRDLLFETAREHDSITWAELRCRATIRRPSKYLESEINQEIKRAIADGLFRSSSSGARIEDNATIRLRDNA